MNQCHLPSVLQKLPKAEANGPDGSDFSTLEYQIGYSFVCRGLLRVALTIGSWTNEHQSCGWPDNSCLEFLGDAVLDLCAAETIWLKFPQLDEGGLTRLRASLVSERSLAQVAENIELGKWIFAGKGDDRIGARDRPSTLADCVEALLGAVFLDAKNDQRPSQETAMPVFMKLFGARISAMEIDDGVDAKSKLQELCQSKFQIAPSYVGQLNENDSRSDLPQWTARALVELRDGRQIELGAGTAPNRRDAEQKAARMALRLKALEKIATT